MWRLPIRESASAKSSASGFGCGEDGGSGTLKHNEVETAAHFGHQAVQAAVEMRLRKLEFLLQHALHRPSISSPPPSRGRDVREERVGSVLKAQPRLIIPAAPACDRKPEP